MAAYQLLLLNTAVPQIQAAQAGDTYVCPRDIQITANLDVTGNTILGNASTDTVQVNGYMGVGGTANTSQAVRVVNTALSGTAQSAVGAFITGTAAATDRVMGVFGNSGTEASAFTLTTLAQFYAGAGYKGSGSTITNAHGVYIADQTQGTNNYGITSLVSSGTNKWNIYASGTAANYFAGNVGVGTTTFRTLNTDTPIFQIVGGGANSASAGLTRNSNDSGAPILYFGKTRGTTPGGTTAVSVNDDAALLRFTASDGTDLIRTAQINVSVDGGVSTGVVPGRFVFSLANTSGALTERFRLSSSEAVFNDLGNDYDFRVESDTNTHALFVQGSDGFVGIGTSTPNTQLVISGAGATLSGSTTYNLQITNTSTGFGVRLGQDGTNGTISGIGTSGLTFWTYNGSAWGERLRIDSSGNLGLGVTPSAWATLKGFEIGTAGSGFTANGAADLQHLSNAYYNAGWKYASTNNATRYSQSAGAHAWFTAPSGTANNAITFTERASISATEFVVNNPGEDYDFRVESDTNTHALFVEGSSGNVGIGTSSPNASAILDAQSTTKGVRMPNMTTTQKNAIVSPAAGLIVFDTTLAKLCVYSGSAWETITSV